MSNLDKELNDFIVQNNEGKILILDGAISQQCTKALDSILKKSVDEKTSLAIEFYKHHKKLCLSNWTISKPIIDKVKEDGKLAGLFYVVDPANTNIGNSISFSEAISNMDESDKANSEVHVYNNGKPNAFASMIYDKAKENGISITFDSETGKSNTELI